MNYFRTTPYSWTIAILVLLNLGTLAALWWRSRSPVAPPLPEEYLRRELNLSDEQAARFRDLRREHFAKTRPAREAMMKERRRMIEQAAGPAPDRAAALAQARRIGNHQMEIDSLLIDHFLELRAVCTPEQQRHFERIFLRLADPAGPGRRGGRNRRR